MCEQYATSTVSSESILSILTDAADLGIWEWDLQSGVFTCSPRLAFITGCDAASLAAMAPPMRELVSVRDAPLRDARIDACISGKTPRYEALFRIARPDGPVAWVHEKGTVTARDASGRAVRMGGLVLDVTGRQVESERIFAEKRLRELLAEKETAGERLAEEVRKATVDLRTQEKLLVAANRMASMLLVPAELDFGSVLWKSLEILGMSVDADRAYIWRIEKDREDEKKVVGWQEICEWARCAVTDFGGSYRGVPYDELSPVWSERLLAGDNVNLILDTDANKIRGLRDVRSMLCIPLTLHGAFWGIIGFDDCRRERLFTEQEQAMLKSCGMLVASAILRNEMMEKLVEARERALTSMHAKSEFLSRMSHEIRTPMNAIIGMTAIARKTQDEERIAQCLEKIDTSSRQLLGIINDVLDMSKIDANKLEISVQEFDFEETLRHVFDVVQVRADEKRITLELFLGSVPTRRMKSDELRLSQVLINLMNNAVKFTPECGIVHLEVRESVIDAESSRIRVEVRDNGIGIAPERIPRLFDSFVQADGGITREYGGTGLGLAIAKRIIALMNGTIWVESELGVGSSFIFEIEVGWGEACRSASVRETLPRGLRVMVVSAFPNACTYLRGLLGDLLSACDVASNGAAAADLARRTVEAGRRYDIILADWEIPGMSDLEALEAIRSTGCGGEIVALVPPFAWDEAESDARAAGVTHLLVKPILAMELYDAVADIFAHPLKEPEAAAPEAAIDWSGRAILLADDIEINREIVSGILEDTGVTIDMAHDGAEAVRMFTENPGRYDLILMDMQMPVMDGLSACREIRASERGTGEAVPILAMTANAFKEDEASCLAAGMNGHIAKPLEVEKLLQVLSRYLG